jgi:hypothetical protein
MVARQGTEHLQDLIYTLKSFGVPIKDVAWMFGDNQSVVMLSTIPHSTLGKRWNARSYHKVCEAIASGWLCFEHILGKENSANVMTKPLAWHEMKSHVKMFLFWKGDTADMPYETNEPSRDPNMEGSVMGPGLDAQDSRNTTGMMHEFHAVKMQTLGMQLKFQQSFPIEMHCETISAGHSVTSNRILFGAYV